ncbi:MAG: hypothetical protein H7259_08880 [Cytophagales bacterium]|nr:hypothetical protein [Cytophaga sp.]
MKTRHFLLIGIVLSVSDAFSQIETPPRRPFNVAVFSGLGGTNVTPIPALDIRYRGTTLRLAPGYQYEGLGIIQEIIPLSKAFYNAYWIVSGYYFQGTLNIHDNVETTYSSYALLTGVKYYMGRHFFTELQLGTVYTDENTVGFTEKDRFAPYFEFGIGFNIFRNFPKEILEEED